MAKKSSLRLIYFIGMVLVLVGFCVPMFKGSILGTTSNGFSFIDFEHFGWRTVAALLILISSVLGIVFCFVSVGSIDLIRLLCIILGIVGAVIIVINFNTNKITQFVGKQFFKHAYIGFYMILCGWVVALVGWITKK